MDADTIFVIVVLVIIFILASIGSAYLIIYYQHPDDKNEAYFPKLVVFLGMMVAVTTIVGFPLDARNKGEYAGCEGFDTGVCGGLNMEVYWNICFWCIPVWLFVLIPFSSFYYEADDGYTLATMVGATPRNDKPKSKIVQALCSTSFVLIFVILVFALTYLFMSDTNIPVMKYTGAVMEANYTRSIEPTNGTDFTPDQFSPLDDIDVYLFGKVTPPDGEPETEPLKVGIGTFYAGLMAWLGWFFFAIFGGVGLAALPVDLILGFINRPRHMNPEEYAEIKESLQKRVNEMVDMGEKMKEERVQREQLGSDNGGGGWFNREAYKDAREERNRVREFKAAVFLLEEDVTDFTAASERSEKFNPLLPWLGLFAGILSLALSVTWLVQIFIYVIPSPPLHPFLNALFTSLDFFPLFSQFFLFLYTGYLFACAMKGAFKFGLRFVCMDIHPMRPGKTYMSSMMFNLGLVLICALPIVQFCAVAFSTFAQYSTIRQMFLIELEYIPFFSFFWTNNIFIYAFLAIALLTVLYLIICRKRGDDTKTIMKLRDRLTKRS